MAFLSWCEKVRKRAPRTVDTYGVTLESWLEFIGKVDYIGRIEAVSNEIVELTTDGHELAIRLDAVDAIIVRTDS